MSADRKYYSNTFNLEFIELYKQEICLWKVRSPDYSNKNKRNEAIERLLSKLQEWDANSTTDHVRKKINSLRTAYRRERKQIKDFERSGRGTEEVYIPKLSYFPQLSFLRDQDDPSESISTLQDNFFDSENDIGDLEPEVLEQPTTPTSSSGSFLPPRPTPLRRSQKRKKKNNKRDDLIGFVHETLSATRQPAVEEDNYSVFGKLIANDLREFNNKDPCRDATFLMKIINEAVFQTKIGKIQNCKLIEEDPNALRQSSNDLNANNRSFIEGTRIYTTEKVKIKEEQTDESWWNIDSETKLMEETKTEESFMDYDNIGVQASHSEVKIKDEQIGECMSPCLSVGSETKLIEETKTEEFLGIYANIGLQASSSEVPIMTADICDVFNKLKTKQFGSLSFDEKKAIINNGRPTPQLNLTKENRGFTRKFNTNLYKDVQWLCGNISNNKLYCWPCLLFSKDDSVWNCATRGYDDLNNLQTAISRHEKSLAHINAFVDLKTFGKSKRVDLILDKQKSVAISRHNEEVTRNREILKRSIRFTCFLGMQELAFRGHNEGETSDNRGNYIELAHCMAEFDEKLENHFKRATVFKGTSPTIQNDIIHSISAVMLEQIRIELNESMYVAILLDETSDISCLSQLSTVVRYVNKHGEICERFIKFNDVSNDRSAEAISDLSVRQLNELGCLKKLVAQTYDGAAVMGSNLNGVQTKIREQVPEAIFVHCYAHKLNLVLSQAVADISQCNNFFSVLRSLSSFFSSSTQRTAMLDSIVGKRFPKLAPTQWNYSSSLVKTVKENKDDIMNLLEIILENPSKFDENTKNSARGLLAGIETFDFNFLLEVFSLIFPFTEYLFSMLQKKSMDIVHCLSLVENTIKKIKQMRDTKFEEMWDLTKERCGEPVNKRKRSLSPKEICSQLFHETFNKILLQMEERFSSMEKLEFIELLDCEKFEIYDDSFPVRAFESLKRSYGTFFEFPRLRSELCVLYSHKTFARKNVPELLKYLLESEMHSGLRETHKLTNLILTIPIATASVERSFAAINRIKNYVRNSQSDGRLSNLALISIEKNFLKNLMDNRESFYNRVTEEICKKTRSIEFIFK